MTKPQPRYLGRLVEHDPRSLEFPAKRATRLRSVSHQRMCGAFQQGNVGSCTGNAMAGALMTQPLWNGSWKFTENDSLAFYTEATRLDGFPGEYPAEDTGSSGLAVAKAAKAKGYISGYRHAFGLQHALEALVLKPVIVGTNWYDSMYDAMPDGEVRITPNSKIIGGHEYEMSAIDVGLRRVWFWNSWGPEWGKKGTAWMSWDTFDRLLHEQGDVTTFSKAPASSPRGMPEAILDWINAHVLHRLAA